MIVKFTGSSADETVYLRADKVIALRTNPGSSVDKTEVCCAGGSIVVRGTPEEVLELLRAKLPDVWKVDPYQDAGDGH